MQVNILSTEKGSAKLQILVPAEELTKALDQEYATYSKNHPEEKLERETLADNEVGQGLIRNAVQDVFSDLYAEAIRETDLQVASQPRITVLKADEEEGIEFSLEFALRPEVKLGQYKGIHVACPDFVLTEEELRYAYAQAAKQKTETVVVDRPAQLGDTATIDFTGYLEGVPFDGGAGTDYPLVLGSGSFIPGFEEQLVGASAGDNVVVNVTFPEAYHAPNLAGKATVFRCKVKKVEESIPGTLTEEEKESVKAQAQQQKKDRADQQIENQVLGQIISDAQVEIPQAMIDSEAELLMNQFASELQAQGIDLESYGQRLGKTPQEMYEEMKPMAERRILLRLVLSAVAEAESLTVTEEELAAHWETLAQQYGVDAVRLKVYFGEGAEEEIKAELLQQKAFAFLRENTILEMA